MGQVCIRAGESEKEKFYLLVAKRCLVFKEWFKAAAPKAPSSLLTTERPELPKLKLGCAFILSFPFLCVPQYSIAQQISGNYYCLSLIQSFCCFVLQNSALQYSMSKFLVSF